MQYATIEDTIYLWFGSNNTSGSGDDGATAVYDVRLGGAAASAAPTLSGNADLLTHANYPAGAYEIAIAATVANGFAAGGVYGVFCTLLVDAQNPTGYVGGFKLSPVPANVTQLGSDAQSATDLKDFADAGYDPSTNKVTGVTLVDTVTSVTNLHIDAATTTQASAIEADTQDIQNRLPAALTANGNIKASLMEILTTALTETAGLLAAGFKKFFNIATPTGTLNSLPDAVPGTNLGLLISSSGFIAPATSLNGTVTGVQGNVSGNVGGSVNSVTSAVTAGNFTGAAATTIGGIETTVAAVLAAQGDDPAEAVFKKNVAYDDFPFVMLDTDGEPATGKTVTATRSIDGGAFAATTNAPAEISGGGYVIDLSAADMNGNSILFKMTATGCKTRFFTITTES